MLQERINKIYDLRSQGFGRDKMHQLTGIPVRFISTHMKEFDLKYSEYKEEQKIKTIHEMINEGKTKAFIIRSGFSRTDVDKYSKCDSLDKRSISERIRQEVATIIKTDDQIFNWQVEDVVIKYHPEKDINIREDHEFIKSKRDATKSYLFKNHTLYNLDQHQTVTKSDWMTESHESFVIKAEDLLTKTVDIKAEELFSKRILELQREINNLKNAMFNDHNKSVGCNHKMSDYKFQLRMKQISITPSLRDINMMKRRIKENKKNIINSTDLYTKRVISAIKTKEMLK